MAVDTPRRAASGETNPADTLIFNLQTVGFPGHLVVKIPLAHAGDAGLIPGLGRPPGGGNGNPLQYSCLENPMDRGAWQPMVHTVPKSQI